MTALPKEYRNEHVGLHDERFWIPIEQAATLLEVSTKHLARLCSTKLATQGMAMQMAPKDGRAGDSATGRKRWHLNLCYDERLHQAMKPEQDQRFDQEAWGMLTGKQRGQAMARKDCVLSYREQKLIAQSRGLVEAEWLDDHIAMLQDRHAGTDGFRVSKRSLKRWCKSLDDSGDDIIALVDTRGGVQEAKGSQECWDKFTQFYLSERQPSIAQCWRLVKAYTQEQNELIDHLSDKLHWCSLRSCQQQVKQRYSEEQVLMARDPKAWRFKMAPRIDQNSEAWKANERWVSDHKQLDFFCRYKNALVRPWLTAFQDWRTRKFVGWFISATPPNSHNVLMALHHALTGHGSVYGMPEEVHFDNGKDYDCWLFNAQTKKQRLGRHTVEHQETAFRGIFNELSIRLHFSLPYNPTGKARLERSFRDFEDFSRSVPTYCGRKSEERPESLSLILKKKLAVPDFAEIKDRLHQYIEGRNLNADRQIDDLVYEGERLSPSMAMERMHSGRVRVVRESVLELLLQHHAPKVSMTKKGVGLNVGGRVIYYGAMEPALSRYKSMKAANRPELHVTYNPEDIRQVNVYDQDWRFVASVSANDFGNNPVEIGVGEVKEVVAKQRHYAKSVKVATKNRDLSWKTTQEQIAQAGVEKTLDRFQAEGIEAVSTRMDQAVGSVENVSVPVSGEGSGFSPRDVMDTLAGMGELIPEQPGDQEASESYSMANFKFEDHADPGQEEPVMSDLSFEDEQEIAEDSVLSFQIDEPQRPVEKATWSQMSFNED